MATWTREDLEKIGTADELKISPRERGGRLRKPVTIWVVCVGDDLYIRSGYGLNSAWFRDVHAQHEGRISAAGVEKDVTFVDADANLNEEIDAAYRTKYRRYGAQYVNMMVSSQARSVTIKLVPRSARQL